MPRVIHEQVTVKISNDELEVYAAIAKMYGRTIPDTIVRLARASAMKLMKDME